MAAPGYAMLAAVPSGEDHESASRAYEGVEDLASFTPDGLEAYRRELLERTTAQSQFIAERLAPNATVLELASGNGRLLVNLAAAGCIARATGLEIARSRVLFARRWAEDLALGQLRFEVADVLATEWPTPVDLVVCITGAFAYFDPIQPGAGIRLLRRAREALRPGGWLVLELYPHPADRRLLVQANGHLRLWRELPAEDPWRFYLSDLHFDTTSRTLTHIKTFIHRNGIVDEGRSERLRLFDASEISDLISQAGFARLELFDGWDGAAYGREAELLVVAAQRD